MRAAPILAALALGSAGALARADGAKPVGLAVGEAVNVCRERLVACPVATAICDDPKVAVVENGPEGAELKAIGPGTTLCGLLGRDVAFRHVLRVTVTARPAPKP